MTVTIADHGFSGESAERCLDSLLDLYPESGPVVAQNTATGHLTLVVALDATDPWAASNLGRALVAESLTQAKLTVSPVINIQVTLVTTSEFVAAGDRKLVPA